MLRVFLSAWQRPLLGLRLSYSPALFILRHGLAQVPSLPWELQSYCATSGVAGITGMCAAEPGWRSPYNCSVGLLLSNPPSVPPSISLFNSYQASIEVKSLSGLPPSPSGLCPSRAFPTPQPPSPITFFFFLQINFIFASLILL